MKELKGYANYGMSAMEKRTIFTIGDCSPDDAVASDRIKLFIPDEFEVGQNEFGSILITTPDGRTFGANELLKSIKDDPYFAWYDGKEEYHQVKLEYEEI